MKEEVKKLLLDLIYSDEEVVKALQNIMSINIGSDTLPVVTKVCDVSLVDKEKEIIYYKKQIKELNNQISDLELALNLKEENNRKFEEIKNNAINRINELELKVIAYKSKYEEIKEHNIKLKERLDECENAFLGLKNVYKKYCNLDESIIQSLERILNNNSEKSESIEVFFAHGIQETNIIALWELIVQNYKEYEKIGKLNDMKDIYKYFLELLIKTSSKNIGIILPKQHEIYDERIHTRTHSSNAVGYVNTVVIEGFYIGRNILKKALVEVK